MEQAASTMPQWTIVSEVQLVYKTQVKASERPLIRSSEDSYRVLKSIWSEDTINLREEFKVLLLNQSNRVLGVYELSSGGITGTVADPRLVLAVALKALATSIILAHNHPSGNFRPSRADEELTKRIKAAAQIHDIKLLDHIIITEESYYSFCDEGLL